MKYIYTQIRNIRLILVFILLFISASKVQGQSRNKTSEHYIATYHTLATQHMVKYQIPASITLAQGLLESGAGKSTLAIEGNNHFGIKCHAEWRGGKMYKDDDELDECFRKYKKVEESFDDHSRFLADRPRYSSLFALRNDDYRGWARGLQQAGYATDKAYANKLIKLIEDYELYNYDRKGGKSQKVKGEKESREQWKHVGNQVVKNVHTPYKTHGLVYVVSQDGDTYENIAQEFDFKPKDLYKYNEVPEGFPLKAGDIVYFQNKRIKAQKPHYEHVIQVGESMHSISQRYGLKVKNLYKMNKKRYEDVPEEGDVLKLR